MSEKRRRPAEWVKYWGEQWATFLMATFDHWGSLVTGGLMIGVLFAWQVTGHAVQPWVYWVVLGGALVFAVFLAWHEVQETLVKAETRIAELTEQPDIGAAITNAFIDPSPANQNSSYVVVELRLENHSRVPTTIEQIDLLVEVGGVCAHGLFMQDQRNIVTMRAAAPGAQVRAWREISLDVEITAQHPLEYGRHRSCWARFFVEGLPPVAYQQTYTCIRLQDGTGKWHQFEDVPDYKLGLIQEV